MTEFNFENAEGAETRTRKLDRLQFETDNRLDVLESNPIVNLGMFAIPPVTQTTNTSYAKVTVMDTVVVTRGLITASATTDNITIGLSGFYEINPSINVASIASTELVFALFIDGVKSGQEVFLQGLGTSKPVFAGGTHFMQMNAGQVLDMRIKSTSSATASFYSCGLAVKKI